MKIAAVSVPELVTVISTGIERPISPVSLGILTESTEMTGWSRCGRISNVETSQGSGTITPSLHESIPAPRFHAVRKLVISISAVSVQTVQFESTHVPISTVLAGTRATPSTLNL